MEGTEAKRCPCILILRLSKVNHPSGPMQFLLPFPVLGSKTPGPRAKIQPLIVLRLNKHPADDLLTDQPNNQTTS